MDYLNGRNALLFFCAMCSSGAAFGQDMKEADIPLKKVALFSSGVGFFEHSGQISGSSKAILRFDFNAVNDALKSLVINDTGTSPSVTYPSEKTLFKTLKSLKIDISGNPGISEILGALKGSEIEVYSPNLIKGRIIGVENRIINSGDTSSRGQAVSEKYLSLFTKDGIQTLSIKEIASFRFTDQKINSDLNRALDLVMSSRESNIINLNINLPGEKKRDVSIGYVIPTPVWKVSYRLDLAQKNPFLQGWAIVDNDGNTDWENVELSLVTGRPVSFIQNLYAPYYLSRPVLPLAIAGIAEAQVYDSGFSENAAMDMAYEEADEALYDRAPAAAMMSRKAVAEYSPSREKSSVKGGSVETAHAKAAGEQFEFTVKKPVTLARQQSAMIPLVESALKAEKTLVFSGVKAARGGIINPAISVELTNNTGMKLPAGPITVFDGGTYAGDALIEFFPENDKRIISYGDDLSVTGTMLASNSREVTGVVITKGVMTISRKVIYSKTYTFRNVSNTERKLIIEHPVTGGTTLSKPASFKERTDSLYRFVQNLPANKETLFAVEEETPVQEKIILSQLNLDAFVGYSSSQEIPQNIRTALQKAVDLKRQVEKTKAALADLEGQKTRKISDQDRIRKNLEAAGNQTQQGMEYLKRLTALDNEIDSIAAKAEAARKDYQTAQSAYDAYLATLSI